MKKRKKWPFVLVILLLLLGAAYWYLFMGSRIDNVSNEVIPGTEGTHSLIVYFSRAGEMPDTIDAMASATPNSNQSMDGSDTEAAAKMIQELTGADLYQIRTERYYRSPFWSTAATAWIEEILDLRPRLAAQLENLNDYDVIYAGYPIWWFNAPMAIGSFLESYDLTGKTIVPFCTSTDNGVDVSMEYIQEVSEGATVLEGYRVHNSSLEDVSAWLERIGMLKQTGVSGDAVDGQTQSITDPIDTEPRESKLGYVTDGTEEYRGFLIDNIFHSVSEGNIHYNVYIPESYDGSKPYALYFTLPGYEGLYFQGVAVNLKSEAFGFEAQKYNSEMIIVAPQLSDWGGELLPIRPSHWWNISWSSTTLMLQRYMETGFLAAEKPCLKSLENVLTYLLPTCRSVPNGMENMNRWWNRDCLYILPLAATMNTTVLSLPKESMIPFMGCMRSKDCLMRK